MLALAWLWRARQAPDPSARLHGRAGHPAVGPVRRLRWWRLSRMPRSRGMIAGAAALVAFAAGVGYFLGSRAGTVPRIDPGDAVQVARGQAVYAAQCARCHGVNLEGQPNWRVQLPN